MDGHLNNSTTTITTSTTSTPAMNATTKATMKATMNTATASTTSTPTIATASATAPHLSFDKVGLVGRDKEIRILRNAIQNQSWTGRNAPSSDEEPAVSHHKKQFSTTNPGATDNAATDSSSTSSGSDSRSDSRSDYAETNCSSPAPSFIQRQIRSLVLISGQSGSGKSALVRHVRDSLLPPTASTDNQDEANHATTEAVTTNNTDASKCFRGFFAAGKCELSTKKEGVPYAGIQSAMMELCEQVVSRAQPEMKASTGHKSGAQISGAKPRTLASLVSKGLTTAELELLSQVIPNIDTIMALRTSYPSAGGINLESVTSSPSSLPHASDAPISISTFSRVAGAESSINYKNHTQRITYMLRRFMQILCSYCPVVMVIDDLQWADRASLSLIQSWLMDSRSASLTIIGLYRSNMLDVNQGLKAMLMSLEESKRERSIRIVKLSVEDLSVDGVAEYLQRLFYVSSHQEDDGDYLEAKSSLAHFLPLAQVVHAKTGGNMFFIQQFLDSLVTDGFITINPTPTATATATPSATTMVASDDTDHQSPWTWDINAITSNSTTSGDNIMDLMKTRLRKSASEHWVLSIAACLGATFSASHVCAVIAGLFIHSSHSKFFREVFQVTKMTKEAEIMIMLKTFCSETLIEKVKSSRTRSNRSASTDESSRRMSNTNKTANANGTNTSTNTKRSKSLQYSFIHDKVQEAALSMIPTDDQLTELKYRVGEILLYALSDVELGDKIFMIANLLNTRPDLMPSHRKLDRRMKIIMLNHKAGQQAANASAFHLASSYFTMAIDLLPDNHWEMLAEQSLELYSSAAESHFVATNFATAQSYCEAIINQDYDIMSKVRAYHVLIDITSAGMHGAGGEGPVDRCLDLLSQLGCTLPSSSFGQAIYVLRGLMTAKSTIRRLETELEHNLSLSKDENQEAIMKTLDKLSRLSYANAPELIPLVVVKALRLSLKLGIMTHSASMLTFQGVLIAFLLEDIDLTYKCGRMALKIMKASDDRSLDGKIELNYYGCLHHWRHPLAESFEGVLEASRLGMSTGDVESAAWSLYCYILVGLCIGKPLASLDKDASIHSNTIRDFQQTAQYEANLVAWQSTLNLRGASNHTTKLIGDAFDETEQMFEEGYSMTVAQDRVKAIHKLYLAMYFGEYQLGSDIGIRSCLKWLKEAPSSCNLYAALFQSALCCFCMAHENNPSHYTKHARKFLKVLKRWQKKGNPNCEHYITLLEAEASFLKKRDERAPTQYEEAIRMMRERKYTHDEALANERYSAFLASRGEKEEAKARLQESIRLYKEWGANKKVDMLVQKHHVLQYR